MTKQRASREYLAGRWTAQEARRDMRSGDHAYSQSDGATRWQTGTHIDTADVPAPYERDILKACLQYLEHHPRVAWVARMNTGGVELANGDGTKRYVNFGFTGCSDLIGQLRDGRFLAVECKRAGRNPTPAQGSFLANVNQNGGVAFVAQSADDITKVLG